MSRERLDEVLRKPVVVAPMAGGPSTPDLVVAAAGAGALGFLAAGYQSGAAMVAQMAQVRAATREAFGVNVFLPGAPAGHPERTAAYLESLGPDAAALGATLGDPAWDDDDWTGKILALLEDPPAIVSFSFGCPPPDVITSFQDADAAVAVTVTTPEEAQFAAHEGADCLVSRAARPGRTGRRSATTTPATRPGTCGRSSRRWPRSPACRRSPRAGSWMPRPPPGCCPGRCWPSSAGPRSCAARRAAPTRSTRPRWAICGDRFTETAVTRAFSGRPARGLANAFMAGHPDAPAAYPEINNATRPLRAAAAKAGDAGPDEPVGGHRVPGRDHPPGRRGRGPAHPPAASASMITTWSRADARPARPAATI